VIGVIIPVFSPTTYPPLSSSHQNNNLLKLAVEAARVRATLGEISLALEKVWGRHVASSQVVQGAYNASFNAAAHSSSSGAATVEAEYAEVLGKVKAFAEKEGRRPRILVAKMGQDGHDRGAKVSECPCALAS
jgi:methylmalonyl-CoA mutase